MKKILILGLFIITPFLSKALNSHMIKPPHVYSVGLIPLEDKSVIFKKWNPFLLELTKSTPFKFKIATKDTVTEYEDYLRLGAYDFALVSNYEYENIVDKDEYEILSLFDNLKEKLDQMKDKKNNLYYFVVKKDVSETNLNILLGNIDKLKHKESFRLILNSIELKNNFIAAQK